MARNRFGTVTRTGGDVVDGPWGVLVSLWAMWLFIGAYSIVPASVLSVVIEDMGLSATAASWVVTAPQVAAAVVGIPAGVLLDRVDNRTAIVGAVLAVLVAGVAGWLAATGGSYWGLIGTRLLGGAAFVTVWVAGANVLSGAVPSRHRATAVAVYTTGYPAGYALGQFGAPWVADLFGWPATFAVFPALGAALLPAFVLASRNVGAADAGEGAPRLDEIARVLTTRGVWFVCVMSFTVYSLYMLFNSWMPTYSSRAFGLSLGESGLLVALFPAIGIVARTSGGVVSDRLFGRRKRPVVLISFAATTVLVVSLTRVDVPVGFFLGLVVAGFFIHLQIGLLYTYVQGFVESNVVGTAVAVVSVVGWVGSFVAPAVAGALIEHTDDFASVFGFAVLLGVVGVGVAVVAPDVTG